MGKIVRKCAHHNAAVFLPTPALPSSGDTGETLAPRRRRPPPLALLPSALAVVAVLVSKRGGEPSAAVRGRARSPGWPGAGGGGARRAAVWAAHAWGMWRRWRRARGLVAVVVAARARRARSRPLGPRLHVCATPLVVAGGGQTWSTDISFAVVGAH
jgi:hypothetical protein